MSFNPSSANKKAPPPEPTLAGALWRVPKWFPDLTKQEIDKLEKFFTIFQTASKTSSLVSPKTVALADALHFADSILSSRIIAKASAATEILDLGSGAGFPGIIYAILYPKTNIRLVDMDKSKIDFLKSTVASLGLNNVSVEMRSVESLSEKSSMFAMSRGLSSVSKTILYARRIIKKGGAIYHIKSEEWSAEVGQIPTQLCSFWIPSLVSEYKLPIGEVRFAVVKTEKIED